MVLELTAENLKTGVTSTDIGDIVREFHNCGYVSLSSQVISPDQYLVRFHKALML